MRFACLAVVAACGARAQPVVDYGPPPVAVDPIACPAARLERFATLVGTTAELATEPLVDAGRVDKVPCRPAETDAACLARARERPAPRAYEVVRVTIGAEAAQVDFTYDLDGRRYTEQAPSMQAMVERIKALQASGRKVVLVRGESAPDAGARHAAITYRGVGGQERRIATLRPPPDVAPGRFAADVRDAAYAEAIELRRIDTAEDGTVAVVVTCGP